MPPPLVLVVDDTDDIRELVADVLELEGYAVASAADAREALARVEAGLRPDLLVVDLLMPLMTGDALVRVMRAPPLELAVPVIYATAIGDVCPSDGVLLEKPFDVDRLIGLARALCPLDAAAGGAE